jgi:hypothetical protein
MDDIILIEILTAIVKEVSSACSFMEVIVTVIARPFSTTKINLTTIPVTILVAACYSIKEVCKCISAFRNHVSLLISIVVFINPKRFSETGSISIEVANCGRL